MKTNKELATIISGMFNDFSDADKPKQLAEYLLPENPLGLDVKAYITHDQCGKAYTITVRPSVSANAGKLLYKCYKLTLRQKHDEEHGLCIDIDVEFNMLGHQMMLSSYVFPRDEKVHQLILTNAYALVIDDRYQLAGEFYFHKYMGRFAPPNDDLTVRYTANFACGVGDLDNDKDKILDELNNIFLDHSYSKVVRYPEFPTMSEYWLNMFLPDMMCKHLHNSLKLWRGVDFVGGIL